MPDETARILAQYMESAGLAVQRDGDVLRLQERTLQIGTVTEGEDTRDGRYAIGVAVTVTLDGAPLAALQSGVVGVGSDRAGALQDAAQGWVAYFGRTLVDAVFTRTAPDESEGGYHVYVGLLGIRGSGTAEDGPQLTTVMERVRKGVARALSEQYPKASEWIGITVMVGFDPEGHRCSIYCQRDGRETGAFNQAIMDHVEWPDVSSRHLCKQFYLAVPRT